jgi:CDP-diacylglycerol--serine O-phosphatidyltransferase
MSVFNELKLKDYVTLSGTMFGASVIILSILGLISAEDFFLPWAGLMWAGAMTCDLLDGYVARKLNQVNKIGKEIDSLSDAVSFVVAPSVLILCASLDGDFLVFVLPVEGVMIGVFVLIFFGITRLAWFNVENKGEGYIGMTTPMTAAFLVSFFLSNHYFQQLATFLPSYYNAMAPLSNFFSNTLTVTFICIILGILNVAPFLRYGAKVQLRTGIWKYLIFILGSVMVITIVLARGFMGTSFAKFAAHIFPLFFVFCLLGYFIYGFYNYLAMRSRGELESSKN